MMNLAEIQPVAAAVLPLAELKTHLRLPEGFANDGSFDTRLEQSLRAAVSTAEARTGKALISRAFRWQFEAWAEADRQVVPMAPLVSLDAVTVHHGDGSEASYDLTAFSVIADMHRPAILPRGTCFPRLSRGAVIDITFTAGFGTAWSDVPPDLREAVLILAVDYFDTPEGRSVPGLSPAVGMLLQRYRALSVGRIGV